MIYNKHNLAVAKVASKSDIKPELASIVFAPGHTVATDSFRLIEMSTDSLNSFENYPHENIPHIVKTKEQIELGYMLPAKEVLKFKITKHKTLPELNVAVLADSRDGDGVSLVSTNLETVEQKNMRQVLGTYPVYEQVMPKPDDIAQSIDINAEYLAEVLEVVGKLDPTARVTLHFQKKEGKALYITASNKGKTQHARALVMPMSK